MSITYAQDKNPPVDPKPEPSLVTGQRLPKPGDQGHLHGNPRKVTIEAYYTPFNCVPGQAAFLWLRNNTNATIAVVIQWYSEMAQASHNGFMGPGEDTIFYVWPSDPRDHILYALWTENGYGQVLEMGHWCGG